MKTQETTQQGGEAALLAQVCELQKQLDDCLQGPDAPQPDPSDLESVCWLMQDILAGGFNLYMKDSVDPNPWIEFRGKIMMSPRVRDRVADDTLLHGLAVMNDLIDRLLTIHHGPDKDEDDYEYHRDYAFGVANPHGKAEFHYYHEYQISTPRILLGCMQASQSPKDWDIKPNLAGFLTLREVFNMIGEGIDSEARLRGLLDLIIWCLGYAAKYKTDQERSSG